MEFNEKLQELRKQKKLTQEELAQHLFVSRTAVSKWESGRGYPSIDSLKAISTFFGVSIDELLSGDEILTIAVEDTRQSETRFRNLAFALLDCSIVMFLFLPFFRQNTGAGIQAVSLISLNRIGPYLKAAYSAAVIGVILSGLSSLALHNRLRTDQAKRLACISLVLNAAGALLFIISLQPYAAAFLFIFLAIKALMLIKRP